MEPETPPKKTLLLVFSSYDEEFVSLLRGEGYRIEKCRSGADTLQRLLVKEPDLLLIYGYALLDMTGLDLMNQVNVTLPDRKMRVMWMHNGQFDYKDEDPELFGPKWGWYGIDVSLSR